MVGRCVLRFQRISPKKVKPLLDNIRMKSVTEAENVLRFTRARGAQMVLKALKAARASYRDKKGGEEIRDEDLVVLTAKADRGVILKRLRAAWRGRGVLIRRRTSHITVEVGERR